MFLIKIMLAYNIPSEEYVNLNQNTLLFKLAVSNHVC